VPEIGHWFLLSSTEEQIVTAIVTDTEIHVSFSLWSWSICAENAPLCPSREPGTKCKQRFVSDSIQNYALNPFSSQLESVKTIMIIMHLPCTDCTGRPLFSLRRRWDAGSVG